MNPREEFVLCFPLLVFRLVDVFGNPQESLHNNALEKAFRKLHHNSLQNTEPGGNVHKNPLDGLSGEILHSNHLKTKIWGNPLGDAEPMEESLNPDVNLNFEEHI